MILEELLFKICNQFIQMASDFFTKEIGPILGVPQFWLETIAALNPTM